MLQKSHFLFGFLSHRNTRQCLASACLLLIALTHPKPRSNHIQNANQEKHEGHSSTVICRVKATQEADGGDPAAHVLLRLGHQVPGPFLRLQVKNKAALQLLLCERQASVHLTRRNMQRSFKGNILDVSVGQLPARRGWGWWFGLAGGTAGSCSTAGHRAPRSDVRFAAQTNASSRPRGTEDTKRHEFALSAIILTTVGSSARRQKHRTHRPKLIMGWNHLPWYSIIQIWLSSMKVWKTPHGYLKEGNPFPFWMVCREFRTVWSQNFDVNHVHTCPSSRESTRPQRKACPSCICERETSKHNNRMLEREYCRLHVFSPNTHRKRK